MGMIQVAIMRRDVARSWELHIAHAITPYGVADTYNQCVDQERAECCHKIKSQ